MTQSVPPPEIAAYLLNEYLRKGHVAITELNAPFAVVIYDGRDKTVHIVTDRGGF